ncbi:unnamed protein product [Prorocentrum cordatum]|uniref:Integrase SAM-like N-terminal domain-containing protein n=1 Tax=Prorocentrum cordatum TaxID=2364126 RepID=A0ABN9SU56_9DINO|nr:unnamed protein product [Polarella glacialis]
MARLSYLQGASVRPRTKQLYLSSWRAFVEWSKYHRFPLALEGQVEDAIVYYFEFQYFERAHSGLGPRLAPAFFRQPGAGPPEKGALACGSPSTTRLEPEVPQHVEVADAVGSGVLPLRLARRRRMLDDGGGCAAVRRVLSEAQRGTGASTASAGPASSLRGQRHSSWTAILHPMELGSPSKVNKWDDSRPLDLADHNFMIPLMGGPLERRRRARGPDVRVHVPAVAHSVQTGRPGLGASGPRAADVARTATCRGEPGHRPRPTEPVGRAARTAGAELSQASRGATRRRGG